MRGRLYDELAGLRQSVGELSGDLRTVAAFVAAAETKHSDYENRLRALERWRYALPTAAVSGVLALVLTLLHITGG